MTLNFRDKFKNPSDARIKKFEKKIGTSLPKKFRDYLLSGEIGGKPEREWLYKIGTPGNLDCMHEWDEASVDILCSVYDMEDNYEDLNSEDRDRAWLPDEMIAIGDGPGANHLLVCVEGEHAGKVFFWANDLYIAEDIDDDTVPTYQNICFVANDFDEFLAGLYPYQNKDDG